MNPAGTRMPVSPVLRRILAAVGVCALLGIYLALTLGTAAQKSAHFDETAHVIAGYNYLKYGDYRVNTSNMILGQKLAAVALLGEATRPPQEDVRKRFFDNRFMDTFAMGRAFLYDSGNDPQALLFHGRTMIALLGALAGLGVFFWSRQLFGTAGGLVSLGFFCVCPTFISLGGIIGADMPAACFFLFTVWSYWTLLHRVTPLTVGAFGVSSGLLLLSKLSGLAFGPVALVLLAIRLGWGKPLHCGLGPTAGNTITDRYAQAAVLAGAAAVSAVIVVFVIWAGYGFRFAAAPADATGLGLPWEHFDNATGAIAAFVQIARSGRWLPEAFLFDLANLVGLTGAHLAFLLGETSINGWFAYFPFTFVAKSNPFMIVGLGAVAASALWQMRRSKADDGAARWWNLYDCLPLIICIEVLALIACYSEINIGHRHILPLYPFVFVLLGGLAVVFTGKALWPKLALGLLLAGGLANAAVTHPNPLAYVSPLVGGPGHGYRMLADSSLEWGQELPAVKKWLDAHPKDRDSVPYFSYFGSGLPKAYGIETRPFYGFFDWQGYYDGPLTEGTYLVSATMFQPVYYSRGFKPAGPWCQVYEQWYQDHRRFADAFFDVRARSLAAGNPALLDEWMASNVAAAGLMYGMKPDAIERMVASGEAKTIWPQLIAIYDLLRFARLTHFLRQREPAEVIANSVLVFRLTDQDLRAALDEPLDNLPSAPVITGAGQRR
jgi:hypothetical protein